MAHLSPLSYWSSSCLSFTMHSLLNLWYLCCLDPSQYYLLAFDTFAIVFLLFIFPSHLFRISFTSYDYKYIVTYNCRDLIQESISDQLTNLLVLPHFLTIPINNEYKSSTAYPLPQVSLRYHR